MYHDNVKATLNNISIDAYNPNVYLIIILEYHPIKEQNKNPTKHL